MSLPHTGQLEAIVNGVACQFSGDAWTTPDAALTAALNDATDSSPKAHFTIDERARHVLNKTGLLASSQILSFKSEAWPSELPDETID